MNAGEREGLRDHAAAFLVQCGACDAGLLMSCVCHDGDPRPVIAALLDALEAAEAAVRFKQGLLVDVARDCRRAERKIAAVEALADEWERPGPKVQGTPEDAAAAIRAALAAEDTAELPPRTHRNGPRSDSGPESGQGDHRDDEGRCGCYACIGNEPAGGGSWLTVGMTRMIVCSECGNKRCPHGTDHRNECTGSNEPGQAGSRYGGLDHRDDEGRSGAREEGK